MKITISVGTHEQPFARLVNLADSLARSGHLVRVQYGYSKAPVVASGQDFISASELDDWMADSSLVICHGGPATVLQALRQDKAPIVVPRDPEKGEHVDGHQISFCQHLTKHRMAVVRYTVDDFDVDSLMIEASRIDAGERRTAVASNRANLASSLNSWLGVQ